MRICIDAGHGMGNRTPGLYDPGAIGNGFKEAEITLVYADTLADACRMRGHEVYLTRDDHTTDCPLTGRVARALAAGCDVFISIHCNASTSTASNGMETLHRSDGDVFARKVHVALRRELGLRDRGLKVRDDLAVLRFPGPACLVELGFISNQSDVEVMTYPAGVRAACDALAAVL